MLIEGDCLTAMTQLPNESIDLVLCDLPYGITQNPWDSPIPISRLWQQYKRILTASGVVLLMSHGKFTARIITSNEEWFKYKIVWVKSKATNFLNAKKQPLRKHEDICVFYRGQPTYIPQMFSGSAYDKGIRKDQLTGCYGDFRPHRIQSKGTRYPTDVVYFKTAESEGRVYHPTQKPVSLGRYLVRTYSNENALVLDNCFGSGSFLVAATAEGRDVIGIEKNCDLTEFKKSPVNMLQVGRSRLAGIADISIHEDSSELRDQLQCFIESRNGKDRHSETSATKVPSHSFAVV